MNELIKIQERNGKKAVSARELYIKLGYELSQWSRWSKKNIIENQFAVENEDFVQLDTMSRTSDFALSIDFAKKLSMLARTEAGEKIRYYFIEVEKQAKELVKPMTTLQILEHNIKLLREQEERVTNIEKDVKELKAATRTTSDYFTIIGYGTLHNMNIGLSLAAKLGQKAARICKFHGYLMESLPDPRFGRVHTYPKKVLDEVFAEPLT